MSTVRLVRKVQFSSGHRYWRNDLDEQSNRLLFGPWASRFNHGHNYRLSVAVDGPVDPVTGMVVNIKDVDDVLQERVVRVFDQRSINDEVPGFESRAPTIENLLAHFAAELSAPGVLPGEASLAGICLEETSEFYGEWSAAPMSNITLTRVYEFAAAHRLHVSAFSQEKNVALFGKCNNPAGHGHNYVLEVTVSGQPNAETGMLADIGEIDKVVEAEIVERYDHKHFNEDLLEFRELPPTSEVIALEIFRRLNGKLPAKLERIRLHETNRSTFEVSA